MLQIHIYHYPYMTDFADSTFLPEEHQIAFLKVLDAGNLPACLNLGPSVPGKVYTYSRVTYSDEAGADI